jgi:hypothetical protein
MSSDPEALARIEKKIDTLMEKVDALIKDPSRKAPLFAMETPMHQMNQLCPLCKQVVRYLKVIGVETDTAGNPQTHTIRKCGCRPPDTI